MSVSDPVVDEAIELKRHHVQWASQFAVASELCKRACDVSFTMGNATPIADLMVLPRGGEMFLVDVKGLYKKNFWRIKSKKKTPKLFYVLCILQPKMRFFVMTQDHVTKEREACRVRAKKWTEEQGGFNYGQADIYESRWDILPL